MKAYSYIRMSSERQLHGDSLRRQLEASKNYASTHGFELDTTYRDIGISAFTGDNLRRGALGRFIEAVHCGDIPKGTHLLVESLDRLSRDQVLIAFGVFTDILSSGITIVTLTDGSVYTGESVGRDFLQIVISIMLMSRGHEESAMKQKRVAEAWSNKRSRIQWEKLTSRAPGWLVLDQDRRSFSVIGDRADVVRRIFLETAGGVGKSKLAARLNEEGVKPFGRGDGWHGSSVQKIINNRAVLGFFQPHRMENGSRTPVGEPEPGYFPPIIDEALFMRARMAAEERSTGKASGPKGKSYSNLLGGLGRCAACFGSMVYRNKGQGPKGGVYLTCSNAARRNGCLNHVHFDYAQTETAVLNHVPDFELPRTDAGRVGKLRQEKARLTLDLESARDRAQRLLDEWENTGSSLIRDRLRDREIEIDRWTAQLEQARRDLNALESEEAPEDRLRRVAALSDQMGSAAADDRYLLRASVAGALRKVVDMISFDPDGTIDVTVIGGIRAYRIKGAELLATVDCVPLLGRPGGPRRSSFTHGCPLREQRFDEFIRRFRPDPQTILAAAAA